VTAARAAAPARAPWRLPRVHNRVWLLLAALALGALWGLSFVAVAPNRLVSGSGVAWSALASPQRHVLALAWLLLPLAAFVPPSRVLHAAVAIGATGALLGLVVLAGLEATHHTAQASSLARVSLGGGFWVLAFVAWLAAADALRRLAWPLPARTVALALVWLPPLLLMASGRLDDLSLLKEYANRRDAFDAAGVRHLHIVAAALLPALALGVPLGVVAANRPRLAQALLGVLGVVQTLPSLALFALLIAPFGVGLWPAAIALTLYALLPVVQGTLAGLQQVSAPVLDAGTGMGMTARQLFWRVRVPLALPVLVSALRVTTVQLIGLAVVAALVGAGGFGALVFQGLASSALDLVLLGVLPVIALAAIADAALGLLALAVKGRLP
jgi:osmoprotectant transport system permease protein